MFYADFIMYKRYGVGISGLSYSALPYGNVPDNFKLLYGIFNEVEEIDDEVAYFKPLTEYDMSVFDERESEVLEYIAQNFAQMSCKALSEMNHKEDAWINYRHDTKQMVPFSEAFGLKKT